MNQTSTHTPTPWHVAVKRGTHLILDKQGGTECEENALVATVYGTYSNDANARFIVTACNAHEAMKAALQEIADSYLASPAIQAKAKAALKLAEKGE
jgi:hypothetical protein